MLFMSCIEFRFYPCEIQSFAVWLFVCQVRQLRQVRQVIYHRAVRPECVCNLRRFCFCFLGAAKHLYKRVRPSVRPSVTPSHFRRFRRALEHRVASIGSCYQSLSPFHRRHYHSFVIVAVALSSLIVASSSSPLRCLLPQNYRLCCCDCHYRLFIFYFFASSSC